MNINVMKALGDIYRQIEAEGCSIPVNDRGSGSIGVRYIGDRDSILIAKYFHFAIEGDEFFAPNCREIEYISVNDFGEEEQEVLEEILDSCEFLEQDSVLGFVVCHEHYDMDYTFYITHVKD